MRVERSEPILPARDLEETRAFYAKLGFVARFGPNASWEYEIVARGNLIIHFFLSSGLDPYANESGCYLRVVDADAIHADFAAANLPAQGIPRLERPEDRHWGMREFALLDPSGNLLRVGHNLE